MTAITQTPVDQDFLEETTERLLRYAAIDSQSDARSQTQPSTEIQFGMLHLLQSELEEIGASDITLTEYGAVLATLPATSGKEGRPTVGFMAHVDTTPAFAAEGVKPRLHKAYDGGEIRYPDAPDLVLSPETAPLLADKIGEDIITASGATLLGADDKAGVAIIMTLARHLLSHPELPHGKIRVAFTPDEEIGRGVDPRLPSDLGADFAYTFDGGERGEITWETFSADCAKIAIDGVSTHTGTAQGKMVNALSMAAWILEGLPRLGAPETTSGRAGFFHADTISGNAAHVEMEIILRDFERADLAQRGRVLEQICAAAEVAHPGTRVRCDISAQYRNMRYWLEKDMTPVELALSALEEIGIPPLCQPIRGGTDGSRMTELGTPTPNLFTGMAEIHGPLEWISAQDMALAVSLALAIVARV